MAYTDIVLATSPTHYWPLNETSGTTADDAVGAMNGTCVGLTMGGGDGPSGYRSTDAGGIGGKAPVFTGTEHITVNADKIVGGSAEWTVSGWIFSTLTDSLEHVFYGEMGPSGNDQIRAALKGPSSGPVLSHTYGNDPSVVTSISSGTFIVGVWSLVHFIWRAGGIAEMWYNGAQRIRVTSASSGNAWTNSSLATWIGGPPRSGQGSGWVGRLAHVFVHDRALAAPEMSNLYRQGTPLTRTVLTKQPLFKATSIWRQRLDDPDNLPTIRSDSATMAQRLVNQVASHGVGAVTCPMFVVTDATATVRVRIEGGQNNVSVDKPALYDALGLVRLPAGFATSAGGDAESIIYNTDTDEAFEFWIMAKSLVRPEYVVASTIDGQGGTIPINATPYAYVVYPSDGTGAIASGKSAAATVSTAGSQKVNVAWGTSEGATKYRIYRRLNVAPFAGGNFMIEVDASVHSWIDDGSITPGAHSSAAAAVVTTDWGCSYAGYIADTDDSLGFYEPPRQNWGPRATSLPLYGGLITITEAYAVLTGGTIDHAMAMMCGETLNTHVFPAQRHDWWGGADPIDEGTRYQLDPTYDVTQLSNPIVREIARAYQIYGGYITDHSGAVCAATFEGSEKIGRDPYPEMLAGRQTYEMWAGFPWSRFRVIDPAWTLAETSPVAVTTIPLAELIDDFEAATLDTAKWTAAGSPAPAQNGGKLRIPVHASPYAKVTSTGGPFLLTSSAVFMLVSQRPYADSADQSGLTIAADVDAVHCQVKLWIESVGAVATGGGLKFQYINSAYTSVTVGAVAFDPVAHAWQRIREDSGTVYAETSSDGVVWVPFASFLWSASGWPADALESVNVILFAGNYNSVANRPDMLIESVNVPASAIPPDPPPGGVLVVSPADVRITGQGLSNRKVRVLEVTAPSTDDYLVPATQFGLDHIDLLVAPSNVSDISYPASGTSVQFHAAPVDGSTVPFTVRVMAIGGDIR